MPDTPPPTPAPRPRYALVSGLMKSVGERAITMILVFVLGTAFVRCNGIPTEPVHPPADPISGPVKPKPQPPPQPRPNVPVQPQPLPAPVGPVQPTPPANLPALALTARQYHDNFGSNFSAVADRVESGELTTLNAILDAFKANARPFNESLGPAIQAACGPNGDVSDKDGLVKLLRQVGEATGGK